MIRSTLTTIVLVSTWATSLEAGTAAHANESCTALKPGNPRLASQIALHLDDSLDHEVAVRAVESWATCEDYGRRLPELVLGEAEGPVVRVTYAPTSSGTRRCGSFHGRDIVLYAYAVGPDRRPRSCGRPEDLLVHELGHVLGLRDAPAERRCRDLAMSQVDSRKARHRQVAAAECRAVAERWTTPWEVASEKAGEETILARMASLAP